MNSGSVIVFGIRVKVYDVLERSVEYESKDRWMAA